MAKTDWWHYLRCPYCHIAGGHEVRVPRSTGTFKILESGPVLILNCARCYKTHRRMVVGLPLIWDDMSPREKEAFGEKQFHAYELKGGGKNGKKIQKS